MMRPSQAIPTWRHRRSLKQSERTVQDDVVVCIDLPGGEASNLRLASGARGLPLALERCPCKLQEPSRPSPLGRALASLRYASAGRVSARTRREFAVNQRNRKWGHSTLPNRRLHLELGRLTSELRRRPRPQPAAAVCVSESGEGFSEGGFEAERRNPEWASAAFSTKPETT
jgi:hypothetical protein